MLPRLRRPFGFALAAGLALALLPDPARAQVVVKVNDTVNFRLGFQLQAWADYNQDPISEGYSQNFFLRRVRFLLAGNLAKNVSFFFQTDNGRLGNAPKDLAVGFLVQDAFGEWKVFGNDQFILDAGKMLVPFTRNALQSTSSHLALDGGTWTFLQDAGAGNGLQGDAGRDLGFQFKSYLAGDHLEIRAGVVDGVRAPANAGGAAPPTPRPLSGGWSTTSFTTERATSPSERTSGRRRSSRSAAATTRRAGSRPRRRPRYPAARGGKAIAGAF